MKTIEQVKIELESIESGYPNAESKIRLANGYYVTFRKYDNRGNFKYTSFTIGDAIEKYSKHVTDMELIDAHRDGESMPLVLHVTGYDEYDLV
jgi:hypothetical protein